MELKDRFTELKSSDKDALIAYICAGDPTPLGIAAIVRALVRGGANTIELEQAFDAGRNYDFFDLARSLDVDSVPMSGGYR
ncbi:MAG: tryptophan synthase subunit alpha [Euryarchaeota archaeon]|nr:tryptophan synthase subunit alpha [Euryarchaeota archaeon]